MALQLRLGLAALDRLGKCVVKITFARMLLVVDLAIAGLALSMALHGAAVASNGRTIWFLERATGVVAYVLLSFAAVGGLLTSSRLLMNNLDLPLTTELHKVLSLLALGAVAVHGFVLLFDVQYGFGLVNLLVPFDSVYRPVAVGAGVITAYLMAVLCASFYVKRWIGPKTWRTVHFAAFAAFVLGLSHGLFAGSDAATLWMDIIYTVTGGTVLFLIFVRILGGSYIPQRHPRPAAPAQQPPHAALQRGARR